MWNELSFCGKSQESQWSVEDASWDSSCFKTVCNNKLLTTKIKQAWSVKRCHDPNKLVCPPYAPINKSQVQSTAAIILTGSFSAVTCEYITRRWRCFTDRRCFLNSRTRYLKSIPVTRCIPHALFKNYQATHCHRPTAVLGLIILKRKS